jgi:ABC-2 type transport system ATP-binding protein
MNVIQTQNLTRRFGDFVAVDNLTMEIAEGEIFGFLGPNGAGKTTTIRMLCALVAPTGGQATINGFQLGKASSHDKIRESVGLLTESPGLYELLDALDNMLFYARLYGLSEAEARARAQETLEWLDLWNWRKEPVGTFSKGMKQKLAIGRALLHRPKILFLDEPTASLDAEAANSIREAVLALKEARRTIFLSTHNMEEADRLCDRIAIFKGKLLQLDTPRNLRRGFGLENRRVRVRLAATLPKLLDSVQELAFVTAAKWLDNGAILEIGVTDPDVNNPALVRYLVEHDAQVLFVEENTPSLEEVYLATVK